MAYLFRNFVFEGGGVKGIAYLGAMQELAKRGILDQIMRVGGTSAGAINAVLIGLNYGVEETNNILWNLDFNKFMDNSWGIIRDTDRLIKSFGWYKGDFFRNWIANVIRGKTGNSESTFSDIEAMKEENGFKSMYFMATNLSTGFSEVFSAEHTPRACIADAVRISMSIPLFFAAKRGLRDDVYVDGGVLDNYPIKLFDRQKYVAPESSTLTEYYKRINREIKAFDRPISPYVYNKETLGFRLDSREEISLFRDQAESVHNRIDDFFDFAWALVETTINAQQSNHLHNDDWQRTIYIDTLGVKTTQFDISDQLKEKLTQSGRDGVVEYFKWFDNNSTINK